MPLLFETLIINYELCRNKITCKSLWIIPLQSLSIFSPGGKLILLSPLYLPLITWDYKMYNYLIFSKTKKLLFLDCSHTNLYKNRSMWFMWENKTLKYLDFCLVLFFLQSEIQNPCGNTGVVHNGPRHRLFPLKHNNLLLKLGDIIS